VSRFEIRAAEADDIERLIPLYDWLFLPPGSEPAQWDRARAEVALRTAIESQDACVLLAMEGGEPVGFCTVSLDLHSVRFGYRAWVEDLAVEPSRRSRGIGKRLLDAAMGWSRARGATHLKLDSGEARVDAHRFYEHQKPSRRSVSYTWEL
jgi:GNAT superfamily N-acetyltransferase